MLVGTFNNKMALFWALSGHCETSRVFVDSFSEQHLLGEVGAGDVELLQRQRLLPLHGRDVLRRQVGLLQLQAPQVLQQGYF